MWVCVKEKKIAVYITARIGRQDGRKKKYDVCTYKIYVCDILYKYSVERLLNDVTVTPVLFKYPVPFRELITLNA